MDIWIVLALVEEGGIRTVREVVRLCKCTNRFMDIIVH